MKIVLHFVAQVISAILSPVVLPVLTYCVFLFLDTTLATERKWLFGGITCLCSSLIVSGYVVYLAATKQVGSVELDLREERTKPFLVGIVSYFVGFVALYALQAPPIVVWLMFSSLTTTLVMQLITRWWKVSIHATGISGTLAAWAFHFGAAVYPWFVLVPIVGAARVILSKHTIAQVIVGSLLGALFTAVQLWYFVR
ncbi:MAG: hypothetical protein EAZ92_12965 [Candidatus Kapaibacterium sp.]|nr:MAG: hypothetical protein EAZ92_12965 [Candidatus Kapabacteria bacterium]